MNIDLNLLWFALLVGLASYRLTRAVTTDFIFEDAKMWIWDKLIGKDGSKAEGWRYKVGYLLDCNWCLGFWVSLLITIPAPLFLDVNYYQALLVAFAAASIQGILAHYMTKEENGTNHSSDTDTP